MGQLEEQSTRDRLLEREQAVQRAASFLGSLILHALLVIFLTRGPLVDDPNLFRRYKVTVVPIEQAFSRGNRIIYFRPEDRLPPVDPALGKRQAVPNILEKRPQQIVTAESKPPGRQFVWVPEPKFELKTDIKAPNFIAIAKAVAPSSPKPRTFQPPPNRGPSSPAKVVLPPPPTLSLTPDRTGHTPSALAAATPVVSAPPKPKPRQFEPPKMSPAKALPAPEVAAPPQLTLAQGAERSSLSTLVASSLANPAMPARPRPRPFQAPEGRGASSQTEAELAAPQEVALGSGLGGSSPKSLFGEGEPGSSLLAASRGQGTGDRGSTAAGAAAGGSESGASKTLGAVVGLEPSEFAPADLPEGSRTVSLAVGPTSGTGRGGGLPSGQGGAIVPGLSVAGEASRPGAVAGGAAPAPSSSSSTLSPAARRPPALNTPSVSAPMWPHSRALKPLVEERFQGRVAYVTVMPAPPGTGMAGDWVMWFGEQGTTGSRSLMRPPVPVKGSRYLPVESGAGPQGGYLYLAGAIAKDGRLRSLTALSGLSWAAHALVRTLDGWEFTPAIRNGAPVDIDVVIEIPVTLLKRAER